MNHALGRTFGPLFGSPLRSPLRLVAALLSFVVAAVHVPLVPEHLEEAPYIGVLFILLSVVSVALGVLLLMSDSEQVWLTTCVVMVLALLAFLASRTVGLPQIGDDVGNWSEPLGFPALIAEALAAGIAYLAVRRPAADRAGSTGTPDSRTEGTS